MEPSCDVFCSFRLEESVGLALALKGALAARGVSLYVCSVPAGGSIGKQIVHNLMECKMALILGSASYGLETLSPYDTHKELSVIVDHKIPFFLVKTCAYFTQPFAQFHLSSSVSYYPYINDGENPNHVDDVLVDQIIAKLNSLSASEGRSRPELVARVHGPSVPIFGHKVLAVINGTLRGDYSGDLLNGLAHGKGTWTCAEGPGKGGRYEGEFKFDKISGQGIIFRTDNSKLYEGEVVDFKSNGYGKVLYSSGQVYEGEFKNDVPHGRGKLYGPDSQVEFEGEFKDGKMEGPLGRNVSNFYA